jgi:hypothetical protein
MKLPAAVDSFPARKPAEQGLLHRCPVCHGLHAVSAARAELAYGRQLCCSPDCEGERRRRARGARRRIVVA